MSGGTKLADVRTTLDDLPNCIEGRAAQKGIYRSSLSLVFARDGDTHAVRPRQVPGLPDGTTSPSATT